MPDVEVEVSGGDSLPIAAVLRLAGLVKNSAQAKDVLARGVVYVDGRPGGAEMTFARGDQVVIQAGKKAIARVRLK